VAAERAREVALIEEAKLTGQCGERDLAGSEPFAGRANAQASHVLTRRFAEHAPEPAREAQRRYADLGSDVREARGGVLGAREWR
jgi:hypothetical protein